MGTDVVGLGDLLEEGVGLRRGVLIRMVLHGEAAVGLLELFLRGAAADTQHLVVVQPHRRRLVLPASGRAVRLLLLPELLTRVLDFGWYKLLAVFFIIIIFFFTTGCWQVGLLQAFNALLSDVFFSFLLRFTSLIEFKGLQFFIILDG